MDTYGNIELQSGRILKDGLNFGIEIVADVAARNALTGVIDGTVVMTKDDHILNIYNATSGRWNKMRNFSISEVHSPTTDPTTLYPSDCRAMFTDIANCNTFNLPPALPGYEFMFYKTTTAAFTIIANGSNTIDGFARYKNTTSEIYVSCLLKCIIATKWTVLQSQGLSWVAAAS